MMWSVVAHAAPAVVEVQPDHSVVGTVEVSRPAAEVRGRLADPAWIAAADGGGTTVTVESRAGDCLTMQSVTPSIIKTIRYRVSRCTTPTGFREELVDSDAFEAYAVEWAVTESAPGAARIRYTIRTDTTLMVPQFVVDQQTQKGVQRMLDHLAAALVSP